jgi:phytol kinase
MLLRLFVACWFVGSAIFFAEMARANKLVSGERARKLIHIMVGLWGAWLPLWLGWRSIQLLGFMLIVGVYVSSRYKWFKSIHSVSRSTIGEYLFPVAIILLATFFQNQLWFASGMLMMGVADGMAAVIGTRYGKKTVFRVFGQKKSWHGTATFFVLSFAIILWAFTIQNAPLAEFIQSITLINISVSLVFAVGLTGFELIGIKGLDNITVPLITALGLKFFS